MKIAFVGLEKKYSEIAPDYVRAFNRYHLEIPWYYAEAGRNHVTITSPDFTPSADGVEHLSDGAYVQNVTDLFFKKFLKDAGWDVVVHWRKWREDMYVPGVINLLHTCDHSYSPEWKRDVAEAHDLGKLHGILCYRSWHKWNMQMETGLPPEIFHTDCTLGVDPVIYTPGEYKDPHEMLWSSDPGRGLSQAIELTLQLYAKDKRFRLNICYPDYVRHPQRISHPALVWHGSVPNGLRLWGLFNHSGILPYTSTFMEPSSRAHRQAQAAGCLVLYPPKMGSPSELIENGVTGIVEPIASWPVRILDLVQTGKWVDIGRQARVFAESQSWSVQAKNFNALIEKIRGETRD